MPGRTRNYSGPSTFTWNNNCVASGGNRRRHHTHNADQNRLATNVNPPQSQQSSNRGRRRRRHHNSENRNAYETSVTLNEDGMPEYPGLYWDPEKKKYFAISQGDWTGISEYTPEAIARKREQRQLLKDVEQNKRNIKSKLGSLPVLQSSFQRGGRHMNLLALQRKLADARLTNIHSTPNSIHYIEDSLTYDVVSGCKFLTSSEDGTSIFGCWSSPRISFTKFLNVTVDRQIKEKAFYDIERSENDTTNTMGLVFKQGYYSHRISDPQVVDMCIAPIDTEVTGCLYVTARSIFENNMLRSRCSVRLNPLHEWSCPENTDTLDSPIYNIFMSDKSHIWSCGWSSNKMYISLGMEENARICDIREDKKFTISTRGKVVVCQKFTPDGNIIIMCPRNTNIMCSDLRMSNKHWIDGKDDWPQTKNSCFLQPLKTQFPDHVLTQDFDGHLKLWDLRQKTRPIQNFSGHKNNGYKLSCIVDPDERFVFAVGSDSCVRGWSLSSGELLCELPSSQPPSDDPQIAYSNSWGGVVGNTALVVANGSSINVHQFDL